MIRQKEKDKLDNAIEIRGLSKSFRGQKVLDDFNMTMPKGSIYGLIGEKKSGKSAILKIICGLLVPDTGDIKLLGQKYDDPLVRARVGALIEDAGCFPNYSIWMNLKMQAINMNIQDLDKEVRKVLKIVRLEACANLKIKNCSFFIKQRTGIAMALIGNPRLLILDEPLKGLESEDYQLMKEILTDITKNSICSILISTQELGELDKIATHYGIIRQGRMIKELKASEMEDRSKVYVSVKTKDTYGAACLLQDKYQDVRIEKGYIKIYNAKSPVIIADILMKNGHKISEIQKIKIDLPRYYKQLLNDHYNKICEKGVQRKMQTRDMYNILNNNKDQENNQEKYNDEVKEPDSSIYYPSIIVIKAPNMNHASMLLHGKYDNVSEDNGFLKVYDSALPEDVAYYLYENGVVISSLSAKVI